VWLDSYKDTYASFSKAQHEGFRALEAFARFNYAVAGDVLEAGFAQAKATLGVRAAFGTHFPRSTDQRLGWLTERAKA